jgi:hypothetical protein
MAVSLVSLRASSLGGLVQDSAGAPVARARVTLSSQNSPVQTLTTVADAQGGFDFQGLPGGTYDLLIEAPGFLPLRQSVQIGGTEDARLPALELRIGVACWNEKPPSRLRRILFRIRTFFVPVDRSNLPICM